MRKSPLFIAYNIIENRNVIRSRKSMIIGYCLAMNIQIAFDMHRPHKPGSIARAFLLGIQGGSSAIVDYGQGWR